MNEQKDRGNGLTVWLILMVIGSVATIALYGFGGELITGLTPGYPTLALMAFPVIGMVNIIMACLVFMYYFFIDRAAKGDRRAGDS